jgi:hypothetical protein
MGNAPLAPPPKNPFDGFDIKKQFIKPLEDGFDANIVKPIQKDIGDKMKPITDGVRTIKDGIRILPDLIEKELPKKITKIATDVGDDAKDWGINTIWNPINNDLIIPSKNFFEMVRLYINCALNKITNFWRCFIWYVIYIIQETLNIIIVGVCAIINERTGSNALFEFYNMALNGWGYASDLCFEYTGFELLIFPYSDQINAECFVCKAPPPRTPIAQTKMRELKQGIQDQTKNFTGFTQDLAKDITNLQTGF